MFGIPISHKINYTYTIGALVLRVLYVDAAAAAAKCFVFAHMSRSFVYMRALYTRRKRFDVAEFAPSSK